MDVIKRLEKMMTMDESSWHRHSNPWSVYSRFSVLPIISLAFWSREWIGGYSVIAILLSFLWVWVNPRLFGAPEKTNNWASMATFGERIYLKRKVEPIPQHHIIPILILQSLTSLGIPVFIYGLWSLDLSFVLAGNLWIMVFKAWFVDRMVWLYLDMKETNPEYSSWLK
ncbi:DUF6653 family protein [Vibrio diazotrophicus]|uniref:DUF6653 family protein n=1 Tax=Vibrio diazotrophicus TaxID=685 RepID=UPI000C9DAB7F|nr:DUF6653 family protein [Vibrio diazotrophicus]PNH82483.1 hypothetical protein C1N27_03185 [Vibrio diazotrophicus]